MIKEKTDMQLSGESEEHKLEPKLSDDSQAFIGHKLRELYNEVVAEPVPDRLLELLNQLSGDEKPSQK